MDKPSAAELKFVRDMIEHDKEALEKAMERIDSSNGFVAHIATNILQRRSGDIDEMRSWLSYQEAEG